MKLFLRLLFEEASQLKIDLDALKTKMGEWTACNASELKKLNSQTAASPDVREKPHKKRKRGSKSDDSCESREARKPGPRPRSKLDAPTKDDARIRGRRSKLSRSEHEEDDDEESHSKGLPHRFADDDLFDDRFKSSKSMATPSTGRGKQDEAREIMQSLEPYVSDHLGNPSDRALFERILDAEGFEPGFEWTSSFCCCKE